MTQTELADAVAAHIWQNEGVEVPFDRNHLAKLERGVHTWPAARYRAALRTILGASADTDLGFESATSARTARALALNEEDDVNRRQFVLTAMGFPGFVRETLTRATAPRPAGQLTLDDVRDLEQSLIRLERVDAELGGGELCKIAVTLHDRVTAWLNDGPTTEVEAALHGLLRDVGAWTGWLGFDGGHHDLSGRYLNNTIVHARFRDDPDGEVRAMACLANLLCRVDRPRDALSCSTAAVRIASKKAPPRVRALLHLRAARAHAHLGDARAFGQSVNRGYTAYGSAVAGDAPRWIQFVTEAELDGLTACGLVELGDYQRAVDMLTPIVENPDPSRRRNALYYRAVLAGATLRAGDIAQAAEHGLAVLPDAAASHSERIMHLLAGVKAGAEPHAGSVPAARRFVAAYAEAVRA